MRRVKNFLKHLSNITLSQEQIKEVESVRDIILYPCTLINKEYLAIPKDYDNLIISLRTAYANE